MDKYTVMDMIGEGSFGRVFRGKDKQTGEVVALKLIPKIGHSEKEIRSLRSECKIQKELNHPNIVRMIDAFETDNEVISVAEYVPGELFRLFDQYKIEAGERRLPEQRVKEIAGDLISALHYLHINIRHHIRRLMDELIVQSRAAPNMESCWAETSLS